jgi:hypothetical protein
MKKNVEKHGIDINEITFDEQDEMIELDDETLELISGGVVPTLAIDQPTKIINRTFQKKFG